MDILAKYAKLLVNYCLELKAGEKLFISSTTLAEPLVREVYREALNKGAHVEVDLSFRGMSRIFYEQATGDQLSYIPTLKSEAMQNFDAYLAIRAPFNLKEDQSIDPKKRAERSKALKSISQAYFDRTATKELKRSLCQFPTQASAQEADMSLEEYQDFVFNACNLFDDNPQQAWLDRRASQQKIVDFLNQKDKIRYVGDRTDITFSVKDRIWINSDGQTNMPSGEVFTGPIENSVNGKVFFSYPAIFMGKEVQGITLHVEDGQVIDWSANRGKDILDEVFKVEGARYFGEVAIGTNYNIQKATKNILFDEKIGGTIHMAVGQSYKQTGGTNQSAIHWDMITDMKTGGKIYADNELIYENGNFTIF